MKKLSFLFAALLSVSTLFVADQVYKTISFDASNTTRGKSVNDYTTTWTSATNGFEVSIANFNNNLWKWTNIRCGRKTSDKTGEQPSVATITTTAAIDKAITKVVVTIDDVNATYVNSTKLTVASDNKFTQDLQEIPVDIAKGELAYVVTTPAENLFYKLTYDCKSATSAVGNGFVQVSKIEYITSVEDIQATAIELEPTTIELEQYKNDTIKATLTPADANIPVVWTSDNEAVVTVAKGVLTAIAEGTATITATAGDVSATCAVTVKEATIYSCAEIVEKAKDLVNNEVLAEGKYVIRGYVTAEQGTPATDFTKYGNYSVWMDDTKDGGKVFEAYQVMPVDGTTIAQVGDFVEVIGDITKYINKENTTIETVAKTGTIRVITSAALNYSEETAKAKKIMENGQLIIVRDGIRYNVIGAVIE